MNSPIIVNPLLPSEWFSSVKGVIFDCDGVILDSFEANKAFYNAFRRLAGLGPMSPADELYVHAQPVKESLQRILPSQALENLEELRGEIDYREVLGHLKLNPGLIDLLVELREQGVRLAINTNRTTTMDLVMDRFGLRQYFLPVITASATSRAKPHPEGVHRILDAWGLKKGEAAYIGDSQVDRITARMAGVRFWSYGDPGLQADLHIPDFWRLRQCFRMARNRPRTASSG